MSFPLPFVSLIRKKKLWNTVKRRNYAKHRKPWISQIRPLRNSSLIICETIIDALHNLRPQKQSTQHSFLPDKARLPGTVPMNRMVPNVCINRNWFITVPSRAHIHSTNHAKGGLQNEKWMKLIRFTCARLWDKLLRFCLCLLLPLLSICGPLIVCQGPPHWWINDSNNMRRASGDWAPRGGWWTMRLMARSAQKRKGKLLRALARMVSLLCEHGGGLECAHELQQRLVRNS